MGMTRLVDGVEVEMTPQEEAEFLASLPLPAAAPVPPVISDRQFAQQLAIAGTITEAEALAWAARGEMPAALFAAVAALPEGERFGAQMLLAGATTYERTHPLVAQLGAVLNYGPADLDELWSAAALL